MIRQQFARLMLPLAMGLAVLVACQPTSHEDASPHPAMIGPPPTGTWTGIIDRIVDGDTLWLVVDDPGPAGIQPGARVRVRLLRIDSPELARDGGPAECLAEAATEHLRSLAPEGTRLVAAHDVERQDRFGRELAHLWRTDGLWLNGRMLLDGYASVLTIPPNVALDDEVLALEDTARQLGAGLWSAC